jgi:creatinine amidohydrolase
VLDNQYNIPSTLASQNFSKEIRMPTRFLILTTLFLASYPAAVLAQQPSSRSMDDLTWQEFRQLVPAKIKTVILTVGTLEAHGFINNGADNTVPVGIAHSIAADVNALIAPHIPYGVTDILAPYPGSLRIPEEPFRVYVRAVLVGLVNNGFKNIIILNGHGPQIPILQQLAQDIALEYKVNTLVVNWWILANDITRQVFGEDGGHATNDETAMVQAINPKQVHWDLFSGNDMAEALPVPPDAWSAVPFPATMLQYTPGQGVPKDRTQAKADEYYAKVVAKVKALVLDTLHRWEVAGFN